jgi:hypothetical protein
MRSYGHCRRPRCLRKGCSCRCGACRKAKGREVPAGEEVHTLVARLEGPSGKQYEATYEVQVPERGTKVVSVKEKSCDCGKPVDPELKAFCADCYAGLKAKYRKEVIAQYGHEVLSKEAHLCELQEAVVRFLNDTKEIFSKHLGCKVRVALIQALANSKKMRPRKT